MHFFLPWLPDYNLSFSLSNVPSSWKISKVTPIPKPGDKTNVNNLRPVSLLPLPGEIAERLVHDQLNRYLEDNDLLNPNQNGFREGRSTMDSIATFTDDVLLNINRGCPSIAVFVDMRKAFDTVSHGILLKKLDRLGLHPMTIGWLKDYLTNRFQLTLANNVCSTPLPVRCGVPQGSILGPLLYLIYVNDIDAKLQNCSVKLYADDTVLYVSAPDAQIACDQLQPDLNIFAQWCKLNQLTINTTKTKAMLFGTRHALKLAPKLTLRLDNKVLDFVDSYTYLGACLDGLLDFEKHAKNTLKLVAHKIKIFSKIRAYVNKAQALTIYKAKILPYFYYADLLYIGSYQRTLTKLQKQQNRALRICLCRGYRVKENALHKEARVELLSHRREAHLNNYMYKRKGLPEYINNSEGKTRLFDAVVLSETHVVRTTAARSIQYKGAKAWNSLPAKVRNLPSYGAFKLHQKQANKHRTLNLPVDGQS